MSRATRLLLFRDVQHLIQETYPFLNVERMPCDKPSGDLTAGRRAVDLLCEIGLNDNTTVAELEIALQQWFGFPVEVLRKSGNTWMKTRFTRLWSLREQNEQGRIITADMSGDVQ